MELNGGGVLLIRPSHVLCLARKTYVTSKLDGSFESFTKSELKYVSFHTNHEHCRNWASYIL